jgi:hypothetical protein
LKYYQPNNKKLSFLVGFWLTGFCPGHLVEAIALVPINRYVDIIILPEVVLDIEFGKR